MSSLAKSDYVEVPSNSRSNGRAYGAAPLQFARGDNLLQVQHQVRTNLEVLGLGA